VLGLSFGGDERDVGLPDLRGRVPIGGNPPGGFGQGTLTMTWLIATNSGGEAPMLGMIVPFGGDFAPAGWAICDGTLIPISANVALFEAIGTAFGGNPQVYFALPNLTNAAPIGAGGNIAVGNQVPGPIAGLGLNYLICTSGPVAPAAGNGSLPPTGGYVGQVVASAAAQIPSGWSLCDGSLIATSANPALFELIGYTYGGDRRSNFALPDLRGKMLPGT
ncbi:MAG: tail fiber protein, partial [Sphingomonadales bacterium]